MSRETHLKAQAFTSVEEGAAVMLKGAPSASCWRRKMNRPVVDGFGVRRKSRRGHDVTLTRDSKPSPGSLDYSS